MRPVVVECTLRARGWLAADLLFGGWCVAVRATPGGATCGSVTPRVTVEAQGLPGLWNITVTRYFPDQTVSPTMLPRGMPRTIKQRSERVNCPLIR